ncbi:sulfatase-like hydrolase/transferase [candidate division KSB1 bacterium]|nr:sulfatase-like hydrolase/transferase [candidate division KSB1 bacterium]
MIRKSHTRRQFLKTTGLLAAASALPCLKGSRNDVRRLQPNIIYILADDLGYGDLSCYGQNKFSTPNLDQLARSGIRFTHHSAGSTVCAPSRSVLLTGLHTGRTPIKGNKEYETEGQQPMPESTVTVAKLLRQAGYRTGAFGKWGLGFVGTDGDPNAQGFDEFFGYNCQRQAHRHYPSHLWYNHKKITLEGNDQNPPLTYAPDVIHEKALEFIETNREHPFFLYLPYTLPHAELIVPDDDILRKYKGTFEEKPYIADEGSDYGADMIVAKYCSQETPRAVYAAMVDRLDCYVGEVVAKIAELNLSSQTLIMFSSDNGPHQEGGADPQFFNSNGGLRGHKRDLYEGGIRVPFIASWPGHIPVGNNSDHISAFWDILPTFAELAGVKTPSAIDGISLVPTLMNRGNQREHDYLYWEFHEWGGRVAVRKGNWKAVRLNALVEPQHSLELYNLNDDPHEQHDVAKDHPDLVKEIEAIINREKSF